MKIHTINLISFRKYLSLLLFFSICGQMLAQPGHGKENPLIRYVAMSEDGGLYENDGLSWEKPKNKVQLAINDLRRYMELHHIKEGGKVFVKAGTYLPTESTDKNSVNVLNTSFLIYEGITVYGGFPKGAKGHSDELHPDDRPRVPVSETAYHYEWEYVNKTVLSGSHAGGINFIWNETTQQYDAVYSGNSYHVVWFATNGFKDTPVGNPRNNYYRANSLKYEAGIDGCVIEGGNASYKDMVIHNHTAYGGGAYMVKNSFLRNCELTLNSATRRGGAVYMDGGGKMKNCYVHRNQCPGLGGVEGYGGGVAIDMDGSVTHSVVVNNFARIGGGMVLSYDDGEPDGEKMLLPSATSSLIANNTASQEAGGVFFNNGGSVNHLTIVRNRCNGADVTIKGVRYGRSAGVYMLECGNIYNSVIWGGQNANNRDIQMAQHSSTGHSTKIRMNYTAIAKHDITDWTNVVKVNVLGLETKNNAEGGTSDLFPEFKKVSSKAGILVEAGESQEGKNTVNVKEYFQNGENIDWQPLSVSALRDKSVQIIDLHDAEERRVFAHINNKLPLNKRQASSVDLLSFDPRDVVGAYYAERVKVKALGEGVDNDKNLVIFVDPSQATLTTDAGNVGNSWANPLNNLNMALDYFRNKTWKEGDVWKIVAKEGTLTTVGKYYNRHMRSSYIDMADHVTIEGGYSKKLVNVDLTTIPRNPLKYRTVVSGNIAEDAYDNNVCHIVTFYNVSNAVLDGVYLDQANAVSTKLFDTDPVFKGRVQFQHGGGVICWNTLLGDKSGTPVDMSGNVLRNCVISNCSAHMGSAVYVHAEKGTNVSLKMENCIVHNNTSARGPKDTHELSTLYVGVDTYVTQNSLSSEKGTATLELNHCDIIKNVGHPIITEVKDNLHQAAVKIQNSMVWANASEYFAHTQDLVNPENSKKICKLGDKIVNFSQGSTNCVLDKGTSIPATVKNSLATLTYKKKGAEEVDIEYPDFINPTIPVGAGQFGDVTVYGGAPDFTPKSMNPVVNRAAKGDASSLSTDMISNPRTAGGLPDVGALENMKLPADGKVFYVKPSGDDKNNDGKSWTSAFATLSHALDMVTPKSGQQIWVAQGKYRPTQLIEYESTTQEQNERGYLVYKSNKGSELVYSDAKGRKYYKQNGVEYGYELYAGDTQSFKPKYAQLVENGYLVFTTNKTDMTITADYIYQQTVAAVAHYYKKDGQNYVELKPIPQAGDLKPVMEQKKEGNYWVFTTNPDTPDDSKNWVYQDDTQKHSYWKEGDKYFEYKSKPGQLTEKKVQQEINSTNGKTYLVYKRKKGSGPDFLYENNGKYYELSKDGTYKEYIIKPGAFSRQYTEHIVQDEVNGYLIWEDNSNPVQTYYEKDNIFYWKDASEQYVPCKDVPKPLTEVPGTTQKQVYGKYVYEHTSGDLYYSDTQGAAPYYWYNAGAFVQCQNPPTADQLKPVDSTEPLKTADGKYLVYSDGTTLYYKDPNSGLFYEEVEVPKYENYTLQNGEKLTPVYVVGRTAYKMIEGVDVYGGFPDKGNPSFRERNPKAFETRLEAGEVNYTAKDDAFFNHLDMASVGRVLTQFDDFKIPTTWDGLSFTNGFLHSVYRQNLKGRINAIRDNIQIAAEMGAAGVYLRTSGVLENCEIKDNLIFVFPKKGSTLHVNNSGGGCHAVAGGVYNNGGTLKNCVISHNQMVHRFAGISSWMYGVGLFQSNGTVYNTIIADNLGKVVHADNIKPTKNFTVAGAGAFLQSGDFYNNTIVDNRSETFENATPSTHIVAPGIYVFDNITMYNCIVANNTHNLESAWITAKETANATPIFYGYPVLATIDPADDATGESSKNPKPNPAGVKAYHCCVISEEDPFKPGVLLPDKNLISKEPQFNNLTDVKDPKLDDGVKEARNKYHLLSGSPCINTGTEDISREIPGSPVPEPIIIPDVDADYKDRVQDCRIDMGAFEYNGAYDITPTIVNEVKTEEGKVTTPGQFCYYVSERGAGVNSGSSIDNAACGSKLQLVLDAAGRLRHKLLTTDEESLAKENLKGKSHYEIVVRLAGNTIDNQKNMTEYVYTPRRSVDGIKPENENPRSWSLMVPRGVTLQGGWTEAFEGPDNKNYPDVTGHPTIISGKYNAEDQEVQVYHTITFTKDVFDEEQNILKDKNGAEIGKNALSDETLLAGKAKLPRAVLCGLFVRDGMADGELEEDNYGGAAVVTDYAHVRNCVLQDNYAYEGGGALSLAPEALVSGSLLKNNESKLGGAIYVESIKGNGKEGAPTENVLEESAATRARIYTSTIVDNRATKSGGGLYFTNNLRVNSCVFWNNHSSSQADVAGVYEKNDNDTEFKEEAYPFAYSAVESLRLPGLNNRSVSPNNDLGVRFQGTDKLDPYYGLTDYSILLRNGMPIAEYKTLVKDKLLAPRDFERTARYLDGQNFNDRTDDSRIEDNKYIDVGARSLGKRTIFIPEAGHVLKRIFVAHPDKVDIEKVKQVQSFRTDFDETYNSNLTPEKKPTPMPLNAELGGSYSYPMQSLDDALRYIITARMDKSIPYEDKAFFEIFVSGGTFYPESSPIRTLLEGEVAGTADTPPLENEGDWDDFSRTKTFLVPEGVFIMGGVNPAGMDQSNYGLCQDSTGTAKSLSIDGVNGGKPYVDLVAKSTTTIRTEREWFDLNSNDIYEPWEMKEQTILSGKNINKEGVSEVYHVVMVSTDPHYVGYMGKGNNKYIPEGKDQETDIKPGVVRFDGVQISNGKAWHDVVPTDKPNPQYVMDYVGGGIYASGVESMSPNENGSLNVKFRPIHLKLSHCRFIGNRAGWGGALMVNLPCDISSCAFERNEANAKKDKWVEQMAEGADVKGMGSAIFTANFTLIANCLFANNEAKSNGLFKKEEEGQATTSLPSLYGAGTIAAFAAESQKTHYEIHGKVSMLNSNVVNNKAQRYPAVFAYRPNSPKDNDETVTEGVKGKNNNSLMNCIFWGNEAEDAETDPKYNYVINFNKEDLSQADEAMWFCAYEKGRGREPLESKTDMRGAKIEYTTFLKDFFTDPESKKVCNNNLYLNSNNFALDGPNFTNPSLGAGVDYFMPTANWQPYRQNHLTDNGWSYLKQTIKQNNTEPISYTSSFDKDDKGKYIGAGAYYTFYYQINNGKYASIGVPLGTETYMKNKQEKVMHRISYDPNPSHDQTYIDIGLYEYQHVRLEYKTGQPEDVLWVSEREKGAANGKSWDSPTSNLQRAIETLLSSRNGNAKAIHLMQGSYTPTYVLDNNLGFRIDTKSLDQAAVGIGDPDGQKVKSFRILGGWSAELREKRDIEFAPTKIVMTQNRASDSERTKHLFEIASAQQRIGVGTESSPARADGKVIPILFDGITFMNPYGDNDKGGAAIYYADQKDDNNQDCKAPEDPNKPKLTITRCIFAQNGADSEGLTDKSSAVKVGKGGGRVLLSNDLFHSNGGASLNSVDLTHIVNCTFALNGGNVQLSDKNSKIFGSALWRNNTNSALYGGALEVALPDGDQPETDLALFNCNAWTKKGEKLGPYDTQKTTSQKWINCVLSDDNTDIIYGPNFADPLPEVGKIDFDKRDFKLGPSTTLLNQCDGADWKTIDSALPEASLATDLANLSRVQAARVDIGAYEYQLPLQRVVYVDLSRVANSGNGDTWDQAYKKEHIQMAIDMAAVYAAGKTGEDAQAYVYVKSPSEADSYEGTLTLRDGVSIYGGIDPAYVGLAKKTHEGEGVFKYENKDVFDFEKRIRKERSGVAGPLGVKTTIAGVTTSGKYERTTVLDGFELLPVKGKETEPAIFLKSEINGVNTNAFAPIVVRNCIVHGFHAKDKPIIKIDNGLLYNSLVRNNTADENKYILDIDGRGWAVNNTFVSDTGIDLVPASTQKETWRFNILGKSSMATFAPYFRKVKGVPEHKTKNENLWYQLAEQSLDIDKTNVTNLETDNLLPEQIRNPKKGLIDMENDLDLLGNPRRLGKFVDFGCFETWSAKNQSLVVSTDVHAYGGCHYPHPGSVVYTGAHNLEVDAKNFDVQEVPEITPGYFLLQKDGGWYGHGAARLELSYAAVECDLVDHNLVSLPFAYDYGTKGCQLVDYVKVGQDENTALQLTDIPQVEVAAYDRGKRAASDYLFAKEKSGCWTDVANRLANSGVYYHINTSTAGGTYRFTQWNSEETPIIYKEGLTAKTVTLHQANHTDLAKSGKPVFTAMENMGWNLVGQPYLVSRYSTYASGESAGMNVPHVIYKLKNNGDYEVLRSWYSSSSLGMGEAFFTQTAVLKKNKMEELTFDFPIPENSVLPAKKKQVTLTSASGWDEIVVNPSAEAVDMSYHFGADGVKWMAENEVLPQLYLENEGGTRFSLVSAAPVATELKLGVRMPESGEHTFALPCRDDFAEFSHVWLTDHEEEMVTDLKEEDYTVAIEDALDTPDRFTLKFGGAAPILGDSANRYQVFIHQGVLHIRGLLGGEQIRVYDVVGRDVLSDEATAREYTTPLSTGVYVVKVNGNVYKVR